MITDDDDFDVKEEDLKRIVRKSLEPDFDEPETHESDNNSAAETKVDDSLMDNEAELKDEDAVWNKMIDDAIDTIHNFVPKRKRKEKAMFNDLCFEDEKRLRVKNRGAPYYWHMPFRHGLYSNAIAGSGLQVDVDDDNVADFEDSEKVDVHTSR